MTSQVLTALCKPLRQADRFGLSHANAVLPPDDVAAPQRHAVQQTVQVQTLCSWTKRINHFYGDIYTKRQYFIELGSQLDKPLQYTNHRSAFWISVPNFGKRIRMQRKMGGGEWRRLPVVSGKNISDEGTFIFFLPVGSIFPAKAVSWGHLSPKAN